jgi:phage terminase large subunit-like protein
MGVGRNYFDKKKYPNCFEGHNYAVDVVEGVIPSCIPILGACTRYLKDLEEGKYPFMSEWAEKYLRLVQKFPHVKGNWPTEEIIYEPWQKFIFMNIMGFKNPDTESRRFRTAHVEVPRGCGKSLMASQAVLYFLALDNPKGNEISTVATRKEQARIVLDSAREMAKKAVSFRKATGVQVLAHTIVHPASASKVRALSSDHSGLDGLNDALAVADEIHAMRRDTFDVIASGMSKRTDSLFLCITTAGFDTEGVGHSQSQYAKKVASGEMEDDQFFAAVYCADDGDDIFDEMTWRKANPNYGISVDPITFAAKAMKAQEVPSDLANFKVKHLNIWLSEARAFFDVNKWDQCADPSLSLDQFRGESCVTALDVASKIDLTSFVAVFKRDGIYYVFDKSFVPHRTVVETRNALYENCIGKGYLIETKGEAINYDDIFNTIVQFTMEHNVTDVNADPWNATEIMQRLEKRGINVVEFKMNVANLSEPTKRLDALIREGKIRHNGSPLLRWCLSNVVCKEDHNGNVYPRKSSEKLKIDPIISLLMALATHIQNESNVTVYEERDMRVL